MAIPESPIDLELLTVAVPPRVGGMTSWFNQIARGLSARGWEIRLVGLTDRIEGYQDAPFSVIHLPIAPPSQSAVSLLEKWNRWRKVEQRWESCGLSTPRLRLSDGTPGVLGLASRLHDRTGVPWVVLMGGDIFEETQPLPFSSLLHKRIRSNLNRADRILVDGPDLKAALERQGISPDLVEVHYHGIDLSAFSDPSKRTDFYPDRSEDDSLRLVWHGRLAHHHGPERFLEIAQAAPHTLGRLAGGGEPSGDMARILKVPGCRSSHLGCLDYPDLVDLLRESDLGVYPLRDMAGIPTVLLESMAAGLPTLTLRTGACQKLIEPGVNGFILDSVPEMIECIGELRSNLELRTTIGESAKKRVWKEWSLDASQDHLEEILGGMLEG